MLKLLLGNYLKSMRNASKEFISKKRLFYDLWILFLTLFEWLLFIIFLWWFYFTVNYFPWWIIFLPKILWAILMIVFNFMFLMSFISSIPTLYKNWEINNLFTKPVKYVDIFIYWFLKNTFYITIWSLFILLPLFTAYWIANSYGVWYYLIMIVIIIGMILMTSSLWVILFVLISLVLISINKIFSKWIFKTIVYIWMAMLVFVFLIFIRSFGMQNTETWDSFIEQFIIMYDFTNVLYPFNWFTKLIHYHAVSDMLWVFVYIIFICLSIYVLIEIMIFLWNKSYFYVIQNLPWINVFVRKKVVSKRSMFWKNVVINLLIKDLLIHIKDPVQWTQMLVFFLLIIVYIMIIKWINFQWLDNPVLVSVISFISFAAVVFLISAIAVRFVYPNVSLEWKFFWILKTVPLSQKTIYFTKLIFFSLFLLIVWSIIYFFFSYFIWLNDTITIVWFILLVPLIVFTVVFYFSLGCWFPDFKETNPSKIATSIPWIVAILISNWFVGLVIVFLRKHMIKYYELMLKCNDSWVSFFATHLILIYIVCIILILYFWRLWYIKYKSLEY